MIARWRYRASGERKRLAELDRLDILDSAPEDSFDALVRKTADALRAPMAALTLIDRDRQWFKAKVGIGDSETPRATSFCDHTIRLPDVLVVLDTHGDSRFAANPFVTGPPMIRFYAGAPLITVSGARVGALCILGTEPRVEFSSVERILLARLARKAAGMMETRLMRDRHDYAWPVAGTA